MQYERVSKTTAWRIKTRRSKPRTQLSEYASDVTGEELLLDSLIIARRWAISFGQLGIDFNDARQELCLAAIKLSANDNFAAPKWRRAVMWNRCRDLCKLTNLRNKKISFTNQLETVS